MRGDESVREYACDSRRLSIGEARTAFAVLRDGGRRRWRDLAQGREIELIRQQLGVSLARVIETVSDPRDEDWQRESMTTFDIDQLPVEVVRRRGGVHVALFPGLVCDGVNVSTQVFSDVMLAELSTRAGAGSAIIRDSREARASQPSSLVTLAGVLTIEIIGSDVDETYRARLIRFDRETRARREPALNSHAG